MVRNRTFLCWFDRADRELDSTWPGGLVSVVCTAGRVRRTTRWEASRAVGGGV